MVDRTVRLRWRRRLRRSRRQVEDISLQAEENLERHLFKRLSRLLEVRRFIIAWITLMVLIITSLIWQTRALSGYYQVDGPVAGGIFTEGLVGSFTNANPMFATGSIDSTVSRLIFSGLLKYDANNRLVGDLAQNYTVDERGTTYAVHLRPNVFWQDGQPLSADDVVFTYGVIQNPDAKSPLGISWQGIKVTAPDARTVVFTLPNALSAFPESLTTGIVPRHLLKDVPKAELRSAAFNTTHPVGTGPFKWQTVEVIGSTPETREERIALVPNERYYGGRPKLDRFVVDAFVDQALLVKNLANHNLNAAAGLPDMPSQLQKDSSIREYNVPLTGGVFVFFKTSLPVLADATVRRALTEAVNTGAVISRVGYPVIPLKEPLLTSQIGYEKDLAQYGYNPVEANQLLDSAGWKLGADHRRYKDGKPLSFSLFTQTGSELDRVAHELQNQWKSVGADVSVVSQSETDLQTTIHYHNYDALLHGISIGVDPDVFAYWHSSQADPRSPTRLNLSEYKSTAADNSLEAGRTRTDPSIRTIKYRPFLQAWKTDAPAIALYQPRFLYLTRGPLYGFEPHTFNNGTDRLSDVQDWMVRTAKTTR